MTRLALCLVLQEVSGGPIDPGFGQGGHPGMPGWGGGWGSGAHPDQGLPGHGHPDQGLPGQGGHPGNRPPGSVNLPSHPIYHPDKPVPPGTSPGAGLWVVAYIPGKGFEWVSVTPGVPEKPQPKPPGGEIDNTLPTVPVAPDNTLPEHAAPKK